MSSSDSSDNRTQEPADKRPNELWRKPLAWLGALILAALGAWLTEVFTGALSGIFDPGRYGEPVSVQIDMNSVRSDQAVFLPPGASVTKDDEAKIDPPGSVQQANLLAARGGIVVGPRSLVVTITGKRPEAVRITDIRDASSCTSPSSGTLVWLSNPFQGQIDPSIRVGIDVGRPNQHVYLSSASQKQAYFPDKTILLGKGESHVLVIDLNPPSGKVCQPQLEMTLMDGDTMRTQNLIPDDQRTQIMNESPENDQQYHQVYLWGYICQNLVSAPREWQHSLNPCGSNN